MGKLSILGPHHSHGIQEENGRPEDQKDCRIEKRLLRTPGGPTRGPADIRTLEKLYKNSKELCKDLIRTLQGHLVVFFAITLRHEVGFG